MSTEKFEYEAPAIERIGRYVEDTADNRRGYGWDYYVSARNR